MKLKNNRGDLNGALAVVTILMALLVVSVSMDLAKVQWQKFVLNNQLTFVARIAARQGGIRNSMPEDFDKNLEYMTSGEVYNAVEDALSSTKIDPSLFEMRVGGAKLPQQSADYTFQQPIGIQMKAKIKNSYISHTLGGPEYIEINDSLEVLSEKWNRNNTEIH